MELREGADGLAHPDKGQGGVVQVQNVLVQVEPLLAYLQSTLRTQERELKAIACAEHDHICLHSLPILEGHRLPCTQTLDSRHLLQVVRQSRYEGLLVVTQVDLQKEGREEKYGFPWSLHISCNKSAFPVTREACNICQGLEKMHTGEPV